MDNTRQKGTQKRRNRHKSDSHRPLAAAWFERPLAQLTTEVSWGLPEWGIVGDEQYYSLHRFAVTERNFFREVPMIQGARKHLRRLSDEGARIRIITHRLARPRHSLPSTRLPPAHPAHSLLDPARYPAVEIVELYYERWELEIGFDEVKTHTLEREEALRSRAPERVRQEIWGLAIGYNLIRLEIARVAARAHVAPRRISYRHTLMLIRNFWLTAWLAPPGVLPRRLEALQDELALLLLPPRRSERRFPRAVKIKMSNFPLKRSRRSRRRAS